MMECLKDLVGVMPGECGCLTQDISDEDILAKLKVSSSGLYLDNLPGGVSLNAITDLSACKDFAAIALGSISNSVKFTEGDIMVALSEKTGKPQATYMGQIGQISYAGNLAGANKNYQFILIRGNSKSDAVLTLSGARLALNASVDTELKIIRAPKGTAVGEVIHTFEVSTSESTHTPIPTGEISLPLAKNGVPFDYYFIYEGKGALPKDNKLGCNCTMQQVDLLKSFVDIYGGQADQITFFDGFQNDNYGHGLTLDISIKCNSSMLFCRGFNTNEAVSVAMAYAVWYKAGELLIEEVQKSDKVNRYTTMNKEYLWGKRNHFRAQYEGRIQWLASDRGINLNDSNCFVCNDESFLKTSIIGSDYAIDFREKEKEYRDILDQTQGPGPRKGLGPIGYDPSL